MAIEDKTITITVAAAPTFDLDVAFAALAAGQFGTLSTPSMTSSLINNGSNDSIMSWARRGQADPGANRLYFYGCTHNSGDPAFNFNYVIRYEKANHTWFKEGINVPEPFASNGIHGYGHHALRQADGHQFIRARGSANIYHRARDGAWDSSFVPDMPGGLFDGWNVADSLEWYPDFGTAGALVFSSADRTYTWEPGAGSWVTRYSASNGGGNDGWTCYNRADNRMYMGLGSAMRRLDPDGTVVTRANPPFNCSVAPGSNAPVISSGLAGNKMLAINGSSQAISEFDHNANSWSGTIATLPFSASSNLYFHVTIAGQGVIFHFISGNPVPSSTMHLWKR